MADPAKNFLGGGWTFAPSFDSDSGSVNMLEGEADICSSLEVLLGTTLGERVMLPGYGCNMEELLFENLNTTTKTIISDKIKTSILYHEPRIDAEEIKLNTLDELKGVVLILGTLSVLPNVAV